MEKIIEKVGTEGKHFRKLVFSEFIYCITRGGKLKDAIELLETVEEEWFPKDGKLFGAFIRAIPKNGSLSDLEKVRYILEKRGVDCEKIEMVFCEVYAELGEIEKSLSYFKKSRGPERHYLQKASNAILRHFVREGKEDEIDLWQAKILASRAFNRQTAELLFSHYHKMGSLGKMDHLLERIKSFRGVLSDKCFGQYLEKMNLEKEENLEKIVWKIVSFGPSTLLEV